MTDEEAMEALLNSGGYSFPTWTLKLGLPTDEMCLVMSLIASDKAHLIDLVDNFEMIGIEQIVNMMSESYARLSDENDPKELIPPSAFKVIDHEKDARHLAKNLERRLALRSEKLTIDEKIALWKGL